jgi:exopolyphosphatase/guanosine-5'-triphosphate,3'-diphosphate pyrophosphatase
VRTAQEAADAEGVEDLVAFATSAVRDATDSAQVLRAVQERAATDLVVLSGEDEARLTFLTARRWFGWSTGRLLNLDIGGGSLELAVGGDETPDLALSLPLGAGRVTREHLPDELPCRRDVQRVREWVRDKVEAVRPELLAGPDVDRTVATSKTFRSLARLDGAAPPSAGPLVPRRLTRRGLADLVDELARRPAAERAQLPGVSGDRAHQLLAGAVVAHETLNVLDLDEVQICPWALRERVVLRRLDWLDGS